MCKNCHSEAVKNEILRKKAQNDKAEESRNIALGRLFWLEKHYQI